VVLVVTPGVMVFVFVVSLLVRSQRRSIYGCVKVGVWREIFQMRAAYRLYALPRRTTPVGLSHLSENNPPPTGLRTVPLLWDQPHISHLARQSIQEQARLPDISKRNKATQRQRKANVVAEG